ncbi:acyltransferase [Phyllobacterium salinisoli]|uniref:Acyltransferase n=1 Tax=Phyllobacterium salinisoli TaxID=1899321 RepID=A0A368JZ89_9HYPH|nr:acyltransferase [Phyllobacterium salinisoli]RCS22458.1 acyltransferase [Phyllobacterium salinisoli]
MGASMGHERYENIDALRAIAATAVLIQHFFGDVIRHAADPLAPLVPIFNASVASFDLGRFGVILFFLISGFVIPFSIRGAQPLKRFAISRFFRLYPAMWLAILVLSILFFAEDNAPSAATIIANMTMLPGFLGEPWLSGIYWTLSIELIFYCFCALLFWRGALFNPMAIAVFTLLLVASTVGPILLRLFGMAQLPVQYIGLHVSFLFCGLLVRMALVDRLRWAWAGAAIVTLVQFNALLVIGGFSLQRGDSFFMVGKAPIILAYIAAFALFIASVKIGKPHSRTLSFVGAISYSIYLFHGPIALIVYHYAPLTGGYQDLLIGLACLVLTFVVSWLVYRLLETPMIALGRKVGSSLQGQLVPQNS